MSRKNPFPLDSTIYVAAHHSREVKEYLVVGERVDDKYCRLFCEELPGLNEMITIHLNDRGVPGFAYDDRPNQIFTTREEAELGLIAAQDWWFGKQLSNN